MTDASPEKPQPTVFISYAQVDGQGQVDDDYKERVREFADRLLADGVDVLLDQYELEPGSNLQAYMERSVADPRVTHVLVLSNSVYKAKADGRRGGVGTETTIISPQVYAQLNAAPAEEGKPRPKNKFIAAKFEEGDVIPVMLGSSLHVDLSDPRSAKYGEEYEALLRTLHGKPLRTKPALGTAPASLSTTAAPSMASPTNTVVSALLTAVRGERWSSAHALLREYLETFEGVLRAMPSPVDDRGDYQDASVMETLTGWVTTRDEFAGVLRALAPVAGPVGLEDALIDFFERVANLPWDASRSSQHADSAFDYLGFIVLELLLYTVGVLYKAGATEFIREFLERGFYVTMPRRGGEGGYRDFSYFYTYAESLSNAVNRAGPQRFVNPLGHLLINRVTPSVLTREELSQADAVLWWRGRNIKEHWYPHTLPYWRTVLPAFGRAESTRVALRLIRLLGYTDVSALRADIPRIQEELTKFAQSSGHPFFFGPAVLNFEKLATRP